MRSNVSDGITLAALLKARNWRLMALMLITLLRRSGARNCFSRSSSSSSGFAMRLIRPTFKASCAVMGCARKNISRALLMPS